MTMNPVIHQILKEMGSGVSYGVDEVTERLSKTVPPTTPAELWWLCSKLQEKQAKQETTQPNDRTSIFKDVFSGGSIFDDFLSGRSRDCYLSVPGLVLDFAVDYFSVLRAKNLFSSCLQEPLSVTTLVAAIPTLESATALVLNPIRKWQAEAFMQIGRKLFGWHKPVEWRSARAAETQVPQSPESSIKGGRSEPENVQAIKQCTGEQDAILCFPPVSRSEETLPIVTESASKLSPSGIGLFVVPPSFIAAANQVAVFELLGRSGLAAEAFLALPPAHTRNISGIDERGMTIQYTGLDLGVLVIRKGSQGPLFVGELQADSQRRKLLLKNLERKQEVTDFALGMLVEKEDFRSYGLLKADREYQTQLARQGLPLVNLAELLQEANAPKRKNESSFPDRANALYLPSIGFSEVVTSTEQFRIKPHNYLQLVLKPELVNADFLAKFLNSELGLQARRSLLPGNFISKISVGAVRRGVQIPLPPLPVQSAVIIADTNLRDLATDVENLRKQLWGRPAQVEKIRKAIERVNREETFEEWLKTLPFPLASILWNYHSAAHDPKEQFELLLKFFEGLAEFNATILLSAARRDAGLWTEVRGYLAKERERFETSSFGTWIELTAFISKRLRELWSDAGKADAGDERSGRARCEAALGSSRGEVIEAMLSKQLLGVLRSANQFRNDYGGHYGVLGEETAANLLVQLRSFLSEVRSSFGQAWESYQLLLPTNRSEWTGQHHEVVVNLLQGLNTPFLKETRKLSEPLKRNTLYLLDKDRDNAVELLPLVKISSAPKDAANACYFYNRKQPNGARYVSYHFEKEADRTFSVAEMEQLFRDLFGNGGQP